MACAGKALPDLPPDEYVNIENNHPDLVPLSVQHIASGFDMLDDDSIYLILIALCYTDVIQRLKQLWPLSLTCKRLRALCLPLMFKRVVWPNKHIPNVNDDVPMLPETLWPYIQYVGVSSTSLRKPSLIPPTFDRNFRYHYSDDDYIDELIYAIPRLPRLYTFSVHTLITPPDELIEALFHCPTLVNLSFEETPLNFHLPRTPCKSLHTLRFLDGRDLRVSGGPRLFIRSWRESPGREIYEKIENERRPSDTLATTQILRIHSPFLQHLELASGLTSVRGLVAVTWPLLQTLTLTGPSPLDGEPILQIIQAMPALRELRILYSVFSSRDTVRWCVYPSIPVGGMTKTFPLTLTACSPNLRSLTLSNPRPTDMAFQSIPRTLESLTLPSIYEWPHFTKGLDHAFAIRIVRDVSACGARLRELRIFVNSEPNVDLVNTIVESFPALETLHLGVDVWPRRAKQDIDISYLASNQMLLL